MKNRDELKEQSINNLKTIKSYGPYTRAFRGGTITNYEGFGGYYIDEDSELMQKIKEVESQYKGMVYATIHSKTEFGELYTMLYSSPYEEDEDDVEEIGDNQYNCFAYVWNKSEDAFSEFGSVGVKPALGGLVRIY